jgi:hypothetical protein
VCDNCFGLLEVVGFRRLWGLKTFKSIMRVTIDRFARWPSDVVKVEGG